MVREISMRDIEGAAREYGESQIYTPGSRQMEGRSKGPRKRRRRGSRAQREQARRWNGNDRM